MHLCKGVWGMELMSSCMYIELAKYIATPDQFSSGPSNVLNNISHCLEVTTATVRRPVSDVELTHLMRLARLRTYSIYMYRI